METILQALGYLGLPSIRRWASSTDLFWQFAHGTCTSSGLIDVWQSAGGFGFVTIHWRGFLGYGRLLAVRGGLYKAM